VFRFSQGYQKEIMGKIPENILNEIQDKCDIVEVISSYVPLKQAGRNFRANCPFHHEKTPSFMVSPDKQIYHCFGCNSGGNVFNFIKEYEKIDFIEAVKMLAEKTGVKLPEYKRDKGEDSSIVSDTYTVNDVAGKYYAGLLEKAAAGSEVRRYVEKRGLDSQTLRKFRVGYADSSWRGLTDYLSSRGIKDDVAMRAGLSLKGKEGSCYDLFRNRVVFPICDVRDRIIGFGARVLDDSLPKYINSPETAVYKKGLHLYGLNFAKAAIKDKNFAIITEGYLDVITSHKYGVGNVIASLGTALTTEQIRLLKRYAHNVVILYDADQAGELASLRGLDLFLEEGMNVRIVTLAEGHDPDSFIRKFGTESFIASVRKAESLFSYKLNILKRKFNSAEPESKAEIAKEMLSTISRVKSAIVKAEYIKLLSQELSVKEESVWEELKKTKRPPGDKGSSRWGGRDSGQGGKDIGRIEIPAAERMLARLMLEDAKVIDAVRNELKPLDFRNSSVRHIVEALFSIDTSDTLIDITRLINYLEDKVSANVVSFIVNEEMEIKDKEKNVADCITVIKKENRNARLKDIQNRLAVVQKEGYIEEEKRLLDEFNQLIKRGF